MLSSSRRLYVRDYCDRPDAWDKAWMNMAGGSCPDRRAIFTSDQAKSVLPARSARVMASVAVATAFSNCPFSA